MVLEVGVQEHHGSVYLTYGKDFLAASLYGIVHHTEMPPWVSLPVYKTIDQCSPLMISSNSSYFPKAPPPNIINMSVGVKFPMHEILGSHSNHRRFKWKQNTQEWKFPQNKIQPNEVQCLFSVLTLHRIITQSTICCKHISEHHSLSQELPIIS